MSGWQDIATAPRDGTRVLICCEGNLIVAAHYEQFRDEGWSVGLGSEPVKDWYGDPTHWQPLPTPPEGE